MRVITVARKPLSEASVAANVLKHGSGALNIEGTRIATSDDILATAQARDKHGRHDETENWRFRKQGNYEYKPVSGRWPANLIFGHLEGCVRTNGVGVCVPGCPVAAVDVQTLDRPVNSVVRAGRTAHEHDSEGFMFAEDFAEDFDQDVGGASRYFKQIGGWG